MSKTIRNIITAGTLVGLVALEGVAKISYDAGREAERIDNLLFGDFKRTYGVSFEGPMSDSAACHVEGLRDAFVRGKAPEEGTYYNSLDSLKRAAQIGQRQRAIYEAQSRL